MKMKVIPIVIGALGTILKKIGKRTGGLVNKKTIGDHTNYNIIKIGQNTEKSPGNLRRLAVTQTLMKSPQLKLV